MNKPEEPLKTLARQELARIYGEEEHRDLLVMLRARGKDLWAGIGDDQFAAEYLTAKLALACLAWEYACRESGYTEEGYAKMFFRQIMEGFKSPKMAALAAAFSDYYFVCEKGSEEPAGLLLTARLSVRLNLKHSGVRREAPEAPDLAGLQVLLETLEGFRVSFENLCLERMIPSAEGR
ncbi:MAG: hypothetical protein FGM27_03100 [Candidatus Omnitrophica bacterium]|nr:hypothetical protein [Candidatus Omnitrophota bacterium]